MNLRQPVRAGSFYEATPTSCRHHAAKLADGAELPEDLPMTLYGGIVPHAGWEYSGALAAQTFKAILADRKVQTLVLLGADHCGTVRQGEVYDSGVWRTPLGDVQVDEEIGAALVEAGDGLRSNPQAHSYEHSLEVQVPLIQVFSPGIRIVPVGVPPTATAVRIGQLIGKTLAERFPAARVVGSSDLTHHGGHFPAPGGHGEQGALWSENNDRRMLDLMEAMEEDRIIAEYEQRANACGAGAVAATVAACKVLGATRGICLNYTNSYRIIHKSYPDEPDDTTVGYASVVFA